MREVLRSNDPVALSFAQALLRDARVDFLLLDAHIAAVEGSIGAFPRRLAVDEADYEEALDLLVEAGLTARE
ncbi:MAG: DUF2007 domain-containing protein [Tagaea sp.]|nr:DUF2007 domain-containing protein [Tagaea sp.]